MPKSPLIMAILLATINAFMLAGMSLFAKLLSAYYGPIEVTFFRNAFSTIALLGWIIIMGRIALLKTKRPFAHLFRGAIGTIGIVLGTWALSILPLAETTVLLFTSPLFTVLLSILILKERVGIYRIGAVILGFTGVFIMASPGNAATAIPLYGLLIGLGWGFFSGCVDVCLRWMGKTENSTTTVFYFILFGTLTTGLHWPWAEVKNTEFSMDIIWIILGLGLTGLLSLFAKTQSYRLGEASIIAPFMYTMIIWTILFDYLFWQKPPTLNVLAGAGIIIASNLFILYRETKIKNQSF